jgi:hypothetical protein
MNLEDFTTVFLLFKEYGKNKDDNKNERIK